MLFYTSLISVQKHKTVTLSMHLGYETNVHLPKFIENADTFVVILSKKKSINFINDLWQITSDAFILKASSTVDVTLLGKKKTTQELAKRVFLTCVDAEIFIFYFTFASRAVHDNFVERLKSFQASNLSFS